MNYSFEYIDIILLAMIAGFIFLRLRGILGKKTGFEEDIPASFTHDVPIKKPNKTKYKSVKFGNNVFGNVSITVSLENYSEVMQMYEKLIDKYKVKAITAVIVRDEGVYKTPVEDKKKLIQAYKLLTDKIKSDESKNILEGYNTKTLQGRLQNVKNKIMYKNIISTYLEPKFISNCYAGSTFGVINADGSVYPCEILDKPLGSLRDYDMNFMKLWRDAKALTTKKWIKD